MNHTKLNIPCGRRLQEIDLEDFDVLAAEEDFCLRAEKTTGLKNEEKNTARKNEPKKYKNGHRQPDKNESFLE